MKTIWTSTVALIIIVSIVLAASILSTSVQATYRYANSHNGQSEIQQTPETVVAAFHAALNAHDVKAGLDLFADNGLVHDFPREAYSYSLPGSVIAPTCKFFGASPVCTYNGKDKIGEWLQQLVVENILVQEVGGFQVSGANVTWTLTVSIDGYRSLGIAPLTETGQALVQSGKIQSLTLSLTEESWGKLEGAVVASRQSSMSVQTGGFLAGIVIIGLVFPLGTIFYISRVKSLFEAIPRLERPWLMLEVVAATLLLDLLIVLLGGSLGVSPVLTDAIGKVLLVASTVIFLIAMVMMKRAWTIPSSE